MGLLEALSDKIVGNGDWTDKISKEYRERAKAQKKGDAYRAKRGRMDTAGTPQSQTPAARGAELALNDEYENP